MHSAVLLALQGLVPSGCAQLVGLQAELPVLLAAVTHSVNASCRKTTDAALLCKVLLLSLCRQCAEWLSSDQLSKYACKWLGLSILFIKVKLVCDHWTHMPHNNICSYSAQTRCH